MRLPADHDLRLALGVSSPVSVQTLTVKLNGHALAAPIVLRGTSPPDKPVIERRELDLPATALQSDGLQTLELEFELSNPSHRALRLHRLEIAPARSVATATD
jgi:hypothetical protein